LSKIESSPLLHKYWQGMKLNNYGTSLAGMKSLKSGDESIIAASCFPSIAEFVMHRKPLGRSYLPSIIVVIAFVLSYYDNTNCDVHSAAVLNVLAGMPGMENQIRHRCTIYPTYSLRQN